VTCDGRGRGCRRCILRDRHRQRETFGVWICGDFESGGEGGRMCALAIVGFMHKWGVKRRRMGTGKKLPL